MMPSISCFHFSFAHIGLGPICSHDTFHELLNIFSEVTQLCCETCSLLSGHPKRCVTRNDYHKDAVQVCYVALLLSPTSACRIHKTIPHPSLLVHGFSVWILRSFGFSIFILEHWTHMHIGLEVWTWRSGRGAIPETPATLCWTNAEHADKPKQETDTH